MIHCYRNHEWSYYNIEVFACLNFDINKEEGVETTGNYASWTDQPIQEKLQVE